MQGILRSIKTASCAPSWALACRTDSRASTRRDVAVAVCLVSTPVGDDRADKVSEESLAISSGAG